MVQKTCLFMPEEASGVAPILIRITFHIGFIQIQKWPST